MSSSGVKRRTLLSSLAAASVAATLPAPALSKGKRQWKMAMTWQKVLPGLGTGAVRLAKRITSLSEGKLEVKPFGGGELVPAMGVFDAVAQGTVEMGHCAPYYWLSKSRAASFFCSVPGGLTKQEQNGWLYFGGGQALWDELYAEFGLKAFPAGNTGAQMGGWFNKELNNVEDLRGLKMRIPGIAGEVFSKLGGSSQTIPPQELFTAMQSGVIDALEWVGPWNDMALGFHRVSDYYYGPGFHEGGATLELMVNKQAYDELPKELQSVVKIACAVENQLMASEYHANNIRAYQTLKKEHNVDIRMLPDTILKAFFEVSRDVVAEIAKDSAIAKRIYKSYDAYQRMAMDMEDVSEYGYMKARKI